MAKMKLPYRFVTTEGMPNLPMEGSLTFLKLAEKLLTPEEIAQAAREGEGKSQRVIQEAEETKRTS